MIWIKSILLQSKVRLKNFIPMFSHEIMVTKDYKIPKLKAKWPKNKTRVQLTNVVRFSCQSTNLEWPQKSLFTAKK